MRAAALVLAAMFGGALTGSTLLGGALLGIDHAAAAPVEPMGVASCVPCHGADGIARDVEIPNLAGQNSVYLYNQLKAFKSGSRKHPEMNYMARRMTDRELQRMAEYFSQLSPR